MIQFTVVGHPEPAGSKRAIAVRRDGQLTGKAAVMDDNPKAKPWQAAVAEAARVAANGTFYGEAVGLRLRFRFARPKSHYGTGRNANRLKLSAPVVPIVRPDTLKLARAIEDALTGVVWRDDAQVAIEYLEKVYSVPEGVEVALWPL